jgi:hypothetical protein
MVWGAISYWGKSDIYIFDAKVRKHQKMKKNGKGMTLGQLVRETETAEVYKRVLSGHYVPFMHKLFHDYHTSGHMLTPHHYQLQHDNARPHDSLQKSGVMERLGVWFLPGWPPSSPDFNPIERVWAWMRREIQKQFPKNEKELVEAIKKAWVALPETICRDVVDGIYLAMAECIRNNGD